MGHDLPTIFFPVRVNIEPEGRHWFLLVANPRDEVFQVFNSQVIVFTYFLQVILILDVVIWTRKHCWVLRIDYMMYLAIMQQIGWNRLVRKTIYPDGREIVLILNMKHCNCSKQIFCTKGSITVSQYIEVIIYVLKPYGLACWSCPTSYDDESAS